MIVKRGKNNSSSSRKTIDISSSGYSHSEMVSEDNDESVSGKD